MHYLNKKKIAFRLAAGIFSDKPFQCLYHYESAAEKKIRWTAESFAPDKIFFQLIRTASYAHLFEPKDCVVDLMDCFSYHYLLRSKRSNLVAGYFYQREYVRIKKYEIQILKKYSSVLIISQRDKLLLPEVHDTVLVVPNGALLPSEGKQTKCIDILFTGNLNYQPNIDAAGFLCRQIVPLLIKNNPHLKIMIAGANPHHSIWKFQSKEIQICSDITDMPALKKQARLFIAPMFLNTGIQNKILEAMACGVPVLTTPQAAEAIDATPSRHLFIALSAGEFAKEAIKILEMPSGDIEKICHNARQLVIENFNWEKNCAIMGPFFS